jgi:hypothetical protein
MTEFERSDYLKYAASDSKTVEEIAEVLEDIATRLRAMAKEDGIEIDIEHISEGRLNYRTNDRELAKTYGFYELDADGEPIGVEELQFNPVTGKHVPITVIYPVQ